MEELYNVLKFYNHKIFRESGKLFVYCANNTGLFEIDDRTSKLIQQEGKTYKAAYESVKNLFSFDEFNALIKDMADNYFIKNDKNDKIIADSREVKLGNNIFSLTILLAQECNMRCTYCYAEDGEYDDKGIMTIQTARKAIDFLIEHSGNNKNLSVVLFGGEPLLALPLIKELVPYIRETEEKTGKKIQINMTTNGTLITKDTENYLIDNHIHVQISIDGDKETHNSNRFFANKVGSYDLIIQHTESMREKNLLSARATLTGKQLNECYTFDHLDSLGFHSIAIAPASNLLSEDDFEKLAQEEIKFEKYFEHLVKAKEYKKAKKMKMVIGNLKKIHSGGMRNLACGVGRNMYAVDIHGDLYPCHRFVNEKEYVMGNVNDDVNKREDFINEIKFSKHNSCQDCWVQNLCLGHCPHENFSLTGNTTIPSPKICAMAKSKFEELIHIYLRLSPEEKNILFSKSQYVPGKSQQIVDIVS